MDMDLTPPRSGDLLDLSNEDEMTADETDMDPMDDMMDGDRQLTTDSDAIDGGLNDSDLGTPRDGNDEVQSNYDTEGEAATPEAAAI